MSERLNAARLALLNTIQIYAPLSAPIREDAIQRLYAGMDELQAAAIADVQVPSAAPPLPPGGQPVAASDTPAPPDAAPAPAVANADPKATKARKSPGVKAPEAASAAPPPEASKEAAPPETAAAPPAEAPKQ